MCVRFTCDDLGDLAALEACKAPWCQLLLPLPHRTWQRLPRTHFCFFPEPLSKC